MNIDGGEITFGNPRLYYIIMTLHEIYRFLISYLYPNICPCCEKVIEHDEDFCCKCKNKITPFYDEFKIEYADAFVSYCYYEGKIRYVLRKYKINPCGNTYYAFAFGIVQALRRKQLTKGIEAVVYIPMTAEALKTRGYNQVEYMADEVHHLLNIPVLPALIKCKATKSQKSLGAAERRINLKGAYGLAPQVNVKGKTLLLIDDLCTTGSTLSEAARVLKEAGASSVIAASFAKTKNNEYTKST